MTVNPPTATLSSIGVSSTAIVSGQSATVTITLTSAAPSGGAVVALSSSNTAAASVPANVMVAQGATSVTFKLTAGTVTAETTVVLTASYSNGSKTSTVNIFPPGPTAVFQTSDTKTQGNWISTYGQSGYTVVDNATSGLTPITPSGESTRVWAPATSDVRALQNASGKGRVAAAWYAGKTFSVDINFADQSVHQLAVYCLDWNKNNRIETITVLNATTNAVLDQRTVSSFGPGVYMLWSVSGNVKLQITDVQGFNAVVSGIFLH